MKSPLITMSAITGRPNPEKIKTYMNALNKSGIDGVMLYPRSGCEIDYLTKEWFDTIGVFLEVAKVLDMEIWLYDDFNWPSGHAGGRVTEIEAFRLKSITVKGDCIGEINYSSTLKGSLFGEKYFPDLLNDEATDYFIKCTHEQYRKRFGSYFGNVIKGFFTDEPAIGYCADERSIPYYEGMHNDYKKRYGRLLISDAKECHHNFYKNCTQLIAERFERCFVSKIRHWCESYGIMLTGHLMNDESPSKATLQSGNLLKLLSAFSIPGVDELTTDFRSPSLLALLGGAEYARGKNGAMAELFALGACDMSYLKKRCMIYLAAAFKIDRYFLAVSHMDIRGNRYIKDYFNNFSPDQPDFGGMRLLSAEAKRAAEFAKKDYVPDVLVLYPQEICEKRLIDPIDSKPFWKILNTLSHHGIQWKLVLEGTSDVPMIEFNENMEYRLGAIVTEDSEEICALIKHNTIVANTDQSSAHGVFARAYTGGSILIINMYGESKTYLVNGKEVFLEAFGVYIGEAFEVKKEEELSAFFKISYYNNNVVRAMLPKGGSVSVFAENDVVVTFSVRHDASAYRNGEIISTTDERTPLPDGIGCLYASKSELIKKGATVLKAENDIKYLPSLILSGDFRAKYSGSDVLLEQRKALYTVGEYFSDFGAVEFSAEVTLTKGTTALKIEGSQLYTCVFIDNMLLGEKICAPYVFFIPHNIQRENATLKIVQYSSIAPIFGDTEYFEKHSDDVKWRGTPSPSKTLFGFSKISFIGE